MSSKLYQLVRNRANDCCEYSGMPQSCDVVMFEIDHVIPRKAGGPTTEQNLALACFACNNHKGPNLAGIDPLGDPTTAVQLFHPRKADGPTISNGTLRNLSARHRTDEQPSPCWASTRRFECNTANG